MYTHGEVWSVSWGASVLDDFRIDCLKANVHQQAVIFSCFELVIGPASVANALPRGVQKRQVYEPVPVTCDKIIEP